jgi:hypothetical protein
MATIDMAQFRAARELAAEISPSLQNSSPYSHETTPIGPKTASFRRDVEISPPWDAESVGSDEDVSVSVQSPPPHDAIGKRLMFGDPKSVFRSRELPVSPPKVPAVASTPLFRTSGPFPGPFAAPRLETCVRPLYPYDWKSFRAEDPSLTSQRPPKAVDNVVVTGLRSDPVPCLRAVVNSEIRRFVVPDKLRRPPPPAPRGRMVASDVATQTETATVKDSASQTIQQSLSICCSTSQCQIVDTSSPAARKLRQFGVCVGVSDVSVSAAEFTLPGPMFVSTGIPESFVSSPCTSTTPLPKSVQRPALEVSRLHRITQAEERTKRLDALQQRLSEVSKEVIR